MADFSQVPGIVKDLNGNTVSNAVYDSSSIPEINEVVQGPASNFREQINTNFDEVKISFDKVDQQIENVYKNMVGVVISDEEPTGLQKNGDFWFKVLV